MTGTNSDYASQLVFFVNGRKVTDHNVDPEWTLLFYLRNKLGLCGTKLGCAEGGCGACTVMVSRADRSSARIIHLAVNACLAPVCAMHGMAVTTVEGIGSTRTRLHPVQERIAKAHGSQCGFCTPGIVMSMYALLRSLPRPNMHDLEKALQGNLCRCTGYRPILEGFKTFTEEWEKRQVPSRTQALSSGTIPNGNVCGLGDKCCKFKGNGMVSGNNSTIGKHSMLQSGSERTTGKQGILQNGNSTIGKHEDISVLQNGNGNDSTIGNYKDISVLQNCDGMVNGNDSTIGKHEDISVLQNGDGNDNTTGKHADSGALENGSMHDRAIALGTLQKTSADDQMFSPERFQPYDASQEPIFPPELKKSHALDLQPLRFIGPRVSWYRPTSLTSLLQLKSQFPTARVVTGNTEVGVEVKFKGCLYPVMLSTSGVPELNAVSEEDKGLRLGAAVPLSLVEETLKMHIRTKPEHKTRIFTSMRNMLHWFAGTQIRNVAAVGGNIMTGSPISDLNPIFMAAECDLHLQSKSGGLRTVRVDDKFFTGYRRNIVRPDEVLVSVLLPFTRQDEYFCALKQARRREDDIAIVNLALRVVVQPGTLLVQDATVAVGGMAPTTVLCQKTREALLNRPWDSSALERSTTALMEDLPLSPSAPGGMVRYRQALSLSLFMKAFLAVSQRIPGSTPLPKNMLSAAEPLSVGPPSSAQYFQTVPGTQSKTDMVGRPIVHQSAYKQATGEALYCDDLPMHKNELHLALVLSTHAHARILAVDPSAALDLPGVHGFVSERDLPGEKNHFGVIVHDDLIFAREKVHCHGQVLAAVVADDAATARRAARMVRVDYEDLPSIFTIEEAIAAESYMSPPTRMSIGDPDGAMTAATHVVDGEVRTAGQEQFYLETQAAFAIPKGEDYEMEIIASAQSPTEIQAEVANCLGIPKNRVVCRVKRMGGGFGGKESRASLVALPVAVAANKFQRPVRCMLDRDEDMASTGQRHPFLARYKVGFDSDGRLLALEVQLYCNAGMSMDLSCAVMERAMHHVQNSYLVPNLRVTGHLCRTNLPSNTAFRGFGAPQGMFVAETYIRHIAHVLGKDPLQVAQINMLRDGDVTIYNHTMEACTVRRCLEEVLQQAEYHQRLRDVREFNRQHRYRKRGLTAVPTTFGVGFSSSFMNQAGALIHVYTDGSVLLSHGGVEMGQGLHTKMIQVASRALGIDASFFHISESATDKVPNTMPTAGSISSDLNGMAVVNACEKILERLKPYKSADPNGKWEDWVHRAHFDCVSLSATGFYKNPIINYDVKTNTGRPYGYHTYGAAVSEVELDCLTGDHVVLRTDIVMDLGESLNPAIDVGQIEGAFMQGYGLMTIEEPVVSSDGVLLSRGPGAYKIPGFGDIPRIFNVTLLKGAKNPRALYSSKAVGEPPLFLASSAMFAIREAVLAARGEEGPATWLRWDAPATAARIRLACEDTLLAKVREPTPGSFKPWNIVP